MTKFFRASLFADTARWNATAAANIVHFQSGWYHFSVIPLPVTSVSRSGIETWGDLIETLVMALAHGALNFIAHLPSHMIAVLLIYVWCHDTVRLYNEATRAWQVVRSKKRLATISDTSNGDLLPFVDRGLHI